MTGPRTYAPCAPTGEQTDAVKTNILVRPGRVLAMSAWCSQTEKWGIGE